MNYPLLILFVILYCSSIFLIFSKKKEVFVNSKIFYSIHILVLILFVIEIILSIKYDLKYINYYTDRFLILILILSGIFSFISLKKYSPMILKVYFGLYLIYPIITLLAYFIDRIMFVLVAGPLLFSFMLPKVYYSDSDYEIRTVGGGLSNTKVELIEKFIFTEKRLAVTDLEEIKFKEYSNFKILESSEDSLITLISQDTITFYK